MTEKEKKGKSKGRKGKTRNKCEITPRTRRGVPTSRLRRRTSISLSELSKNVRGRARRRIGVTEEGLERESKRCEARSSRM